MFFEGESGRVGNVFQEISSLHLLLFVNRNDYDKDMKLHSYVYKIILTHCMSFVKTRCFLFKWTTIADTKVLILSINKKLASFYSCGIIYI